MAGPERTIYPPEKPTDSSSAGVFIGIHGDRWVANAINSVECQDIAHVQVVAAVNGQFPGALAQLKEWQAKSRHQVTVVENARNLGPLGSWYLNRDLLTSPWVAHFHQDDEYLPRHLPTLLAAAEAAPEDVLAVFSAMDGVDESGRSLAAPPMDNSRLDLAPTQVTLPAILRRHPLPTPTMMLRNPRGYVDDLAWYDSGAPDSEWFARLACRGRFRVLNEVTVRYRTSAESESQSTGWQSRAWQWAQSLDRIINSADFLEAAVGVPLSERERFSRDLLNAIPARYPDSPIFGFLQFAAAQRMSLAWNYQNPSATGVITDYLNADADSAAARNLRGISGIESATTSSDTKHTVAQLLGDEPTRGSTERAGRAAYRRFGHLLPPGARLKVYRLYDRVWSGRGAR